MECGVFSAAFPEGFSPTRLVNSVKEPTPLQGLAIPVGLKPSGKAALKTSHSIKISFLR